MKKELKLQEMFVKKWQTNAATTLTFKYNRHE